MQFMLSKKNKFIIKTRYLIILFSISAIVHSSSCNKAKDGENGIDGYSSLISSEVENNGNNCEFGGLKSTMVQT